MNAWLILKLEKLRLYFPFHLLCLKHSSSMHVEHAIHTIKLMNQLNTWNRITLKEINIWIRVMKHYSSPPLPSRNNYETHLKASISAAASSVVKTWTCQSVRSFIPWLNNADNHSLISSIVLHEEISQAIGTHYGVRRKPSMYKVDTSFK